MGNVLPFGASSLKKSGLRSGIIVQARMGSQRFPGKVLELIEGKPVLERVIDNCLKVSPRKIIIVAVPDTDENEPILKFISDTYPKNLVDNFCGSENNVLERYYQAALHFKLDVVTRITADCPYIQPKICKEVLDLLIKEGYDYCSNIYPTRSFPRGYDTESFTMDALEVAYIHTMQIYNKYKKHSGKKDIGNMFYKNAEECIEHVTPFMQTHPDLIRGHIKQKKDMSNINLCVDYPEDIKRIEELLKQPELSVIKND